MLRETLKLASAPLTPFSYGEGIFGVKLLAFQGVALLTLRQGALPPHCSRVPILRMFPSGVSWQFS
jgi:hypothetical protein